MCKWINRFCMPREQPILACCRFLHLSGKVCVRFCYQNIFSSRSWKRRPYPASDHPVLSGVNCTEMSRNCPDTIIFQAGLKEKCIWTDPRSWSCTKPMSSGNRVHPHLTFHLPISWHLSILEDELVHTVKFCGCFIAGFRAWRGARRNICSHTNNEGEDLVCSVWFNLSF